MTKPLPHEIIEATRLTQAGRLSEATALLQKLMGLGTTRSEADTPATEPSTTVDVGSRKGPRMDIGVATATRAPDGPGAASHLPPPLRSLIERLNSSVPAQALHRALRRSPSSPAEVVPSVGTFVAKCFSSEAGSRAYKVYIPGRHQGEARPLIVMLHGCTQSPDDFAAGTRMNFVAEEHACFVAYPEQSAAANSSKCWNWFKSGDQKRGLGEPSLIAGITRQIMTDHNIDPRRIYIAGLSAGGAAAAVVAEAYPDLYAAVGVHSGLACGAARDLQSAFAAMQGQHPVPGPRPARQSGDGVQVPTIVFHGDRDATVHPRNGVEVIARARADEDFEVVVEHGSAAAGHTYTRSIHRDVSGRGILEDWVIHGAGHAWSGGSPSGSFTDPQGPDATKAMLRFFLEHVRGTGNSNGM